MTPQSSVLKLRYRLQIRGISSVLGVSSNLKPLSKSTVRAIHVITAELQHSYTRSEVNAETLSMTAEPTALLLISCAPRTPVDSREKLSNSLDTTDHLTSLVNTLRADGWSKLSVDPLWRLVTAVITEMHQTGSETALCFISREKILFIFYVHKL